MVIKNKRELVNRLRWHARQDHVAQGTYGDATVNGHAEFRGCFIGCAATPHTQRGLDKWVRSVLSEWGGYMDDAESMLDRVETEFGITAGLLRVCEVLFENLPLHGAAIEFLPAFGESLPEGVDLSQLDVQLAWAAILSQLGFKGVTVVNYAHATETPDDEWDETTREYLSPTVDEQARDMLLGWLRQCDRERRAVRLPMAVEAGVEASA